MLSKISTLAALNIVIMATVLLSSRSSGIQKGRASSTPHLAQVNDIGTGVIVYVDDDAPLDGDGSSWETAFRYLQDALAYSIIPENAVEEIRVGAGLYKPDQGLGYTAGDRTATFVVPAGIALRGGFAGLGESEPDRQDFDAFLTVLSGDLLGNDGSSGTYLNYEDNSIHILTLIDAASATLVEGVTIQASNRPATTLVGGAFKCVNANLIVSHATFLYNQAFFGGGIYLENCEALLDHCRFIGNRVLSAGSGGAISTSGGDLTLVDCEFVGNQASAEFGGAIYAAGPLTIRRSQFQDNFAGNQGGAIYGGGRFFECEFYRNNAGWSGGALLGGDLVVDCVFRENFGSIAGGAIYGKPTVINSRFIENTVTWDGGAGIYGGATAINCEFTANKLSSVASLGGAAAFVCKPTLGLQICGPATFINCVFNGNESPVSGGGVSVEVNQTALFINCSWTNNFAAQGNGALHVSNTSSATVVNSILWGDSPNELGGNGATEVRFSNIQNGWPGQGNISSDPNFVDPIGPDGIAGTEDDDLRLSAKSPCIDAGDNTALPPDTLDLDDDGNITEPLPIDFDGNRRVVNDPRTPNTGFPLGPLSCRPMVDLGAYEFQPPPIVGDINSDGCVGVPDLLTVINAWGPCPSAPQPCPADLNNNGIVNQFDLLIVIQNWG